MTYLNADEAASLDALVARLESATGVQIVPAIVGKADTYPEVPWTAFGLGAAFSSLALVVSDRLRPEWATASTAATHAVVVLGTGAVCALLAAFVPAVARLLLYRRRADAEVRQYAESMFLRARCTRRARARACWCWSACSSAGSKSSPTPASPTA